VAYLLRKPILALSASDAVRRTLTSLPPTRAVVDRFVAGTAITDVVPTVERLRTEGLQVTLDHLGEYTEDAEQADRTVAAYLHLIDALVDANVAAGAEVSVKLSAVGQSLPGRGQQYALESASRIADAAYAVGARVNLDMEDHTTVDSTLAILHALRADHPDVAVAIQAMLRRTPGDLAELTGPGSRVRLVKGAYDEPADAAFTDPAEVDRAYVRGMKQLMAGEGYPMIASHDPRIIDIAGTLAEQAGRSPDRWEHQMLYGIRTSEQHRLVAQGRTVRVYIPYGDDWYGYFTRRLAERPANLLFFLRAMTSRS
jgi:proline dehydrogenase